MNKAPSMKINKYILGKILKTDNWTANSLWICNKSAMLVFWMSSPNDAGSVQNTMNMLFQISICNWTTVKVCRGSNY